MKGAVFMDQEFYMGAALRWLHPNLTRCSLQYRADSSDTARSLAKLFGLVVASTCCFHEDVKSN